MIHTSEIRIICDGDDCGKYEDEYIITPIRDVPMQLIRDHFINWAIWEDKQYCPKCKKLNKI